MKRTGPTNPLLKEKIENLRSSSFESDVSLFKEIADDLRRPTRERVEVNVKSLQRDCEEGEVVAVPGSVLGDGVINKKINVYAWKFSNSAKKKIEEAGGTVKNLDDLVKDHPEGSGVRLMK